MRPTLRGASQLGLGQDKGPASYGARTRGQSNTRSLRSRRHQYILCEETWGPVRASLQYKGPHYLLISGVWGPVQATLYYKDALLNTTGPVQATLQHGLQPQVVPHDVGDAVDVDLAGAVDGRAVHIVPGGRAGEQVSSEQRAESRDT